MTRIRHRSVSLSITFRGSSDRIARCRFAVVANQSPMQSDWERRVKCVEKERAKKRVCQYVIGSEALVGHEHFDRGECRD